MVLGSASVLIINGCTLAGGRRSLEHFKAHEEMLL